MLTPVQMENIKTKQKRNEMKWMTQKVDVHNIVNGDVCQFESLWFTLYSNYVLLSPFYFLDIFVSGPHDIQRETIAVIKKDPLKVK